MKSETLIFLALDLALLMAIFVSLARIHSRLGAIERRMHARSGAKRPKKAPAKKD